MMKNNADHKAKRKKYYMLAMKQAFQLDDLSIQSEVIAITANWLKQLGKIEGIKVLATKNLLT